MTKFQSGTSHFINWSMLQGLLLVFFYLGKTLDTDDDDHDDDDADDLLHLEDSNVELSGDDDIGPVLQVNRNVNWIVFKKNDLTKFLSANTITWYIVYNK